jgi:NADPH:quinone reductase-like Zn-dependent oxidoreductase
MQAIVYHRYGPPDVLQLKEIERPVPAADQVLICVHNASINPYDWHFLRGTPSLIRLIAGPLRPKSTRLGADVSGEVESVGSNVTRFKPGDTVFGTGQGSFAQFVCAPEKNLALKPASLAFEQAASLPIAGITALQALRDSVRLQPRPAHPYQRRGWRRRHFRRADRKAHLCPRYWCLQHSQCRTGAFNWC